jgi:aminoglycoside 6-adenylyltransferase
MDPNPQSYDHLERKILSWAQKRSDVRAVIVVGSRARDDHPADEWSDLDLMLFVTNPQVFAAHSDWLGEIGQVWIALYNVTGRGDPEWLALFEGGLKVDFVLLTATGSLQELIDHSPYYFVLRRGLRVLFDNENATTPPILPTSPPTPLPTAAEFLDAVNRVLMLATRVARILKHGERWPAKMLCDGELKRHMVTMLEWHARAFHGPEYDTWHGERFLDEWADPRALAALPATFGTYEREDLWRALSATLTLFRWLALETADQLGYAYPAQADQRVTTWLQTFQPGIWDDAPSS